MVKWSKKVLITGGLGYIGSHVVEALNNDGNYLIDVIDRNTEASPNYEYVKDRVNHIYDQDLLKLNDEIDLLSYDCIVHLAALISVAESVEKQDLYWLNNLISTENILKKIGPHTHFIFASTGTAFCPDNPYAYSKLGCEQRIMDYAEKVKFDFTIFRFFNVSGLSDGISSTGVATHLIRRAAMAARGEIESMTIFGDDWGTPDGTAIRDYIHVKDIAKSIVNAINLGATNSIEGLGNGKGYSVTEVIAAMKKVSGVDFKTSVMPPRPGDVAKMVCENQYKHIVLEHGLESMCSSALKGK